MLIYPCQGSTNVEQRYHPKILNVKVDKVPGRTRTDEWELCRLLPLPLGDWNIRPYHRVPNGRVNQLDSDRVEAILETVTVPLAVSFCVAHSVPFQEVFERQVSSGNCFKDLGGCGIAREQFVKGFHGC